MCYLCLADFEFVLPEESNLDQKKKRLVKIKSLLTLSLVIESSVCQDKIQELKEEQYKLSREF